MTCFAGKYDEVGEGRVVLQPTMNYQLVYLQYERIHRLQPHWPLSDIKGMTPRQRRHWLAMGALRQEHKRRDIDRIVREGGIPIG